VDLVQGPDQEVLKEKSQNRQRRTPKGKEIHQEEHLLIEEQLEGLLNEDDLLLEDLRVVEDLQIEGHSDDHHQTEEHHLTDDIVLLEEAQEDHPQEERNRQGVLPDHLRLNLNLLLSYV